MVGETNLPRNSDNVPRAQTIEWDEFSRLLVSRRKLTWNETPGLSTPSLFDPEANTYYVVSRTPNDIAAWRR